MNDFMGPLQRVLLVDDDPSIRRLVHDKLTGEGFEVLPAATGKEALALIDRHGLPHLAIVDLMMPEMDGFEFCRQVQAYCDLPIIILTAVDEEETVIRGIEECAEDYITKPFSLRELVARVRRVLGRMAGFDYTLGPLIEVDEHLTVDFARQRALVDGEAVSLTPTEAKLLYLLIRNACRTVTNEFFLQRLRSPQEVLEDALRVHIHHLRKKIRDPQSSPRYILTERGIGYRFIAASHPGDGGGSAGSAPQEGEPGVGR